MRRFKNIFFDLETVVLRSMVGNPNRHTAKAQHQPFPTGEPVTLYTLDTAEPISTKVLPKKPQSKVFYIDGRSPRPAAEEIETISVNEPTVYLEPHVVSQPIFYNIAGQKPRPIIEERIPKTEIEQSSPILYTITGRPRRSTIDVETSQLPVATSNIDSSPVLYTVIASPRLSPQPTTNRQLAPATPSLYSIVGSPGRTSRGTQVELATPYDPTPILYTIVGNTPPNRDNENRPSARTKNNDVIIYGPNNEVYGSNEKPATLYNVVSQPRAPLIERSIVNVPPKVTPRKATPPPPPIIRDDRNFQTKQDFISEEILTYPSGKTSIPTNSKESTPSKNDTVLLPHRSHVEPAVPFNRSVRVEPYRPPHGFRTQKPHQDRKIQQTTLPVISGPTTNRSSRTVQPKPTSLVKKKKMFSSISNVFLFRNVVKLVQCIGKTI